MTKKTLERHPLGSHWPDMQPEVFLRLQDSIGVHGFDKDQPILLYEGMVLDGWHRYNAAVGMQMPYVTREFTGTVEEAAQKVKNHGLHRSMTMAQRVAGELEIDTYLAGVAPGSTPRTNAQIAEATGASERTVTQVRTTLRRAVPAVVKALKDGDLSAKDGAAIASLPEKKQAKALADPGTVRRKAPAWTAVKPEVGATKEKVSEYEERIGILVEENDRLATRVGLDAGQYSDDERASLEQAMGELRAEVQRLNAQLVTMTESRDAAVRERNELTRQCAMYRNQLARVGKQAA